MGRVGIHDREVLLDNGTFAAINLGFYFTAEHEGDIGRYARDFALGQAWAKPKRECKNSKWADTDFYKNGYIMPKYTQCLLGKIKIPEDPNSYFNLLKGGEYFALGIGVFMDKGIWEQSLCRVKSEADILDTYTYNTQGSIFLGASMQEERDRLRNIPFAAVWGTGAQGIYLYVRATSSGERLVHSIRHCVELGNMLIAPKPQMVFSRATGGLVLVNMEKWDKLKAIRMNESKSLVLW